MFRNGKTNMMSRPTQIRDYYSNRKIALVLSMVSHFDGTVIALAKTFNAEHPNQSESFEPVSLIRRAQPEVASKSPSHL